MGVRVWFSFD